MGIFHDITTNLTYLSKRFAQSAKRSNKISGQKSQTLPTLKIPCNNQNILRNYKYYRHNFKTQLCLKPFDAHESPPCIERLKTESCFKAVFVKFLFCKTYLIQKQKLLKQNSQYIEEGDQKMETPQKIKHFRSL